MSSSKKNLIYQAFYEALIVLLPLFTSPYVARVLGSDNVGKYSFSYTTANYFVLFASLGIKNYGNREISRKRDNPEKLNSTFSSILFLHFLISGIAIISYLVYLWICPPGEKLYSVISGIYVISAFFDISWLFFGLEKFKLTVARSTVIKLVSVICIFLLVRTCDDLWKYILILALANLLSQLSLWLYLRKFVKIVKTPANEIIKHLPQMSILFIPTVAISLYNYMDKIMVGSINGSDELGFYENSENIISVCVSVISSVGTVMMPKLSNLIAKGQLEKGKRYIDASMQLVLCVSVAMSAGLIGIASVFAPVFWGEEFSACSILLAGLAIVLPIKGFANIIRTQFLIPNKQDKAYTFSVCAGAAVNLVINCILISRLGAMGAVIGTIFAELCVCVIQAYACRRSIPIVEYMGKGIPFCGFGIIMGFIVNNTGRLLEQSVVSLIILILLGMILYSGMCYVYFKKTNNRLFLDIVDSIILRRKSS